MHSLSANIIFILNIHTIDFIAGGGGGCGDVGICYVVAVANGFRTIKISTLWA